MKLEINTAELNEVISNFVKTELGITKDFEVSARIIGETETTPLNAVLDSVVVEFKK